MVIETVRELINFFQNERPLGPEEWLALFEKWKVEMSIRSAALFIGVTENGIHKLCKKGELERTRRGHVSSPSVYRYRDSLLVKEVSNDGTKNKRVIIYQSG